MGTLRKTPLTLSEVHLPLLEIGAEPLHEHGGSDWADRAGFQYAVSENGKLVGVWATLPDAREAARRQFNAFRQHVTVKDAFNGALYFQLGLVPRENYIASEKPLLREDNHLTAKEVFDRAVMLSKGVSVGDGAPGTRAGKFDQAYLGRNAKSGQIKLWVNSLRNWMRTTKRTWDNPADVAAIEKSLDIKKLRELIE